MCLERKKNINMNPKKNLREERKDIMESMRIKHENMINMIEGLNNNDLKNEK